MKQLVSRVVSREIDHRIVARAASQSVNQSCLYSVPNFDMYRRPGVLCRSDRRASGSSEHRRCAATLYCAALRAHDRRSFDVRRKNEEY